VKAHFGRKMENLKELKAATRRAKQEKRTGSAYTVIKEVELSDEEFKKFASDFFQEQPWIDSSDGGMNPNGEYRCIRVRNAKTGERVLVNSEGYDYPRYTAIEE